MDRLKRMAIFARVVEARSMNAAARELGMTASAVSQQVRRLEEEIGVVLLHRSTRRLTLTEAGSLFYEDCAAMVAAARRAEQRLAELRDAPVGELRIAVPIGFAALHLPPALGPLLAAHPQLGLRVIAGDERIDLIESRIDLAIRIGQLADSSLVARHLAQWEEVFCAAPAYLERAGTPTTPDDLANHQCLLLAPLGEPQVAELTGPHGEKARVRLTGRIVSNSNQTLRQLVYAGLGISRQLRSGVAEDLAAGRLVRVLPGWTMPSLGVWAVTPHRDNQPAKVRHAIEALRRYLQSL